MTNPAIKFAIEFENKLKEWCEKQIEVTDKSCFLNNEFRSGKIAAFAEVIALLNTLQESD